jgi:putative transcriptional regulator
MNTSMAYTFFMKDKRFTELVASLREGGTILRNEKQARRSFAIEPLEIKHIREAFGLTQSQFAALLGISVSTLQNWEQGRRVPEGPARVLLMVAAKHPEAVLDVVQGDSWKEEWPQDEKE